MSEAIRGWTKKIDTDEKGEPFAEPKKEKEVDAEELDKYQREGQAFLDSYDRFLKTYAQDTSLSYRLGKKFYINLETGQVNLDTRWFFTRGYTREQILWACLHELEHFRDLAEDPKGMKGKFEDIREKGAETGEALLKKWKAAYGASDPAFIERLSKRPSPTKRDRRPMSPMDHVGYRIHHTFDNIFDDVFVNNKVRRRASAFTDEEGEHGTEVKNLYREKLFPQTNYAKHPRHLQFVYKLLRDEMVPDQVAGVSEDVEKALQTKIKFAGQTYTPKEVVDALLKPQGNRDTLASRRAFILKKTLAPLFDRLLMKDIEEWEPQKPQERQPGEPSPGEGSEDEESEGGGQPDFAPPDESDEEDEGGSGDGDENEDGDEDEDEDPTKGAGNPFESFYRDFEDANPDQLDPDEIQEWIDKKREEKENEPEEPDPDEDKTSAERAKEAQDEADKAWRDENLISPAEHEKVQQILREIAPYLDELSRLWRHIVFGESKGVEIGMEGYFKAGSELDIGKVIEEYPQIKRGKLEETRVMRKMTVKEQTIDKPELIRIRLVGDDSGSMTTDPMRIRVLQQCAALILSSLQEFEYYLNISRSRSKTKLHTDTEMWSFGSYETLVKRFREDLGGENEQAEIVRSLSRFTGAGSSTSDHTALAAIHNSLTPTEKAKIKRKKIMEIVFEVTDGGSTEPRAARDAVDALAAEGIIVRAFQIGTASELERRRFNEVWNTGRELPWGQVVGADIKKLIPAVAEALKQYLGAIEI